MVAARYARRVSDLEHETTDVLSALIAFDTVNPPGDERPAMEWLERYLTAAGFDCELLGAEERRPNLLARLRSPEPGPTLCYLGHVDTVLADAAEWSHDPWSGDVADGFVWGRGALDMKSQVAAEAVAGATLARAGWRPARGELLLCFVVDEETGGELGAQWLTAEHPDKVRCDLLVNEGGGDWFEHDGRRIYGVCCAEKGVFRFRVTTDGVAGHASMPMMGDNALLKMAPVLERLRDAPPSFDVTAEPRALLEGLGYDASNPATAIAELRAADPRLAVIVEPMLGVTMVPTMIHASRKINVIPSQAVLGVDCRVPPGLGEDVASARIAEVLGDDGFRVEFAERVVGNGSPHESELMDFIRRWLGEHDPDAVALPLVLPGFTDSRHFRAAFPDLIAYGFFPQKHMSLYDAAPLVHSADERIDVRDLGFAASFFTDLAVEVLG